MRMHRVSFSSLLTSVTKNTPRDWKKEDYRRKSSELSLDQVAVKQVIIRMVGAVREPSYQIRRKEPEPDHRHGTTHRRPGLEGAPGTRLTFHQIRAMAIAINMLAKTRNKVKKKTTNKKSSNAAITARRRVHHLPGTMWVTFIQICLSISGNSNRLGSLGPWSGGKSGSVSYSLTPLI
jgi:hypothetical protein